MTPQRSFLQIAASHIAKAIVKSAYPSGRVQENDSLRREIVATSAKRQSRQYLGRNISPDNIERVIKAAFSGVMGGLTDVSRETINADPHLASVLQKRFGAVASLPWELRPAKGEGVDPKKAIYYAELVRAQMGNIPKLRDKLKKLAWALFDGRAAMEIKWVPGSGVPLRVADLSWIHPRRLNFGPSRELRLVNDQSTFMMSDFPTYGLSLAENDLREMGLYRKFVTWTPQLFGDYPEREGLALRCLYWSFFKRYSTREWMVLLELFGKPWRIIETAEDADISEEALLAAEEAADGLGGAYTARMPQGTKLNVVQPGKTAGEVNLDVIEQADKQISKLVLGQTGTTDGAPAGFNSNQADVMKDEQMLILTNDADEIGEVITDGLCNAIIEVNFGKEELIHAPKFVMRADRPADRQSEINRLSSALNAGLEISVTEAYEVSGFSQPEKGVPIIKIDQPPTPPLSPTAPAPRPVIVYPQGTAPSVAEQAPPSKAPIQETPDSSIGISEAASVTTVNEAREAKGLPALTLPDGSPDPDGNLTVSEYNAKTDAKNALSKGIEKRLSSDSIALMLSASAKARINKTQSCGCVVCADSADEAFEEPGLNEQPSTDFGSPEDLIKKGRSEMSRAADAWARKIESELEGVTNPDEMVRRINDIFEDLDLQPYARALERRMVQAAALGALDNALEVGLIDADMNEKVETSKVKLSSFSTSPFREALQSFLRRNIVSRTIWDKLTADVKRKSFTIAGVESEAMRAHIFQLLSDEIGAGADIRGFTKKMISSLQSAGMVSSVQAGGLLGMSHIETVFRTNTLNAYNYGRFTHASQPSVMKAFPVWEIVAIIDNRARDTHARADGTMLLASDPFWKRAYAPFGFNCRCRIRSRSAQYLSEVVPGSTLFYLPDPGFTSGYASLI